MAKNELLKKQGSAFLDQKGVSFEERTKGFKHWVDARKEQGIWPYNHALSSGVEDYSEVYIDENHSRLMVNLASQDNLGLVRRRELKDAAIDAIESNGIHNGCSSSLAGCNSLTREIEQKLVNVTGMDEALVFNTGWAACYGTITGLVTGHDHIVLDSLGHNCLVQGSKQATQKRHTFLHNNLEHLEQKLKNIRSTDQDNAIFVVTESLFSMHADGPNAEQLVALCLKYSALLILDVSHDFGSAGESGLGLLEQIPVSFHSHMVVCGSFSKTFGSSGGFVLGPAGVRDRLVAFCPTYMFTVAMMPSSSGIINKSIDLVFSEEGRLLRKKLKSNAAFARACFKAQGIPTIGDEGPVLPLLVGDTDMARVATKELFDSGVLVNLVEFPAVQVNQSMFRIQISAAFSFAFILDFAKKIGKAITHAKVILNTNQSTDIQLSLPA